MNIRPATLEDVEQILSIYAPYIEETAVSFETDVPSLEEFSSRMRKGMKKYPWYVAIEGEVIVGYAYAGLHRERAAYQWSVESSVYIHKDHHRKGIARALYGELFSELKRRGFCTVLAGATLPNEGSVGLHLSLGFSEVGVYKKIGQKFGRWHDTIWWQKEL